MDLMRALESEIKPGNTIPNIALLIHRNVKQFGNDTVYSEKINDKYKGITWIELHNKIRFITNNLRTAGFAKGDKMVLFSRNRLEMLLLELAVMAYGGIAVPIFYNFKRETAEILIKHSEAKWLAIEGDTQLHQLSPNSNIKHIYVFDDENYSTPFNLIPFHNLLIPSDENNIDDSVSPETICLNMFTSGTMGTPKCVQLTHQNILSQQASLSQVWNIDKNDRFLSYLPWHHSFGGIFELFSALYNGATYHLESSFGKDPQSIIENWKMVKPTVFFSVPKIYQALHEITKKSNEIENLFYGSGLKFIFTAAASLPEKLSKEFEKRNIPILEGWGLTETSPCCTLTNPTIKRESGLVGTPLPGVSIRLNEEGEIQVKGPNIMAGYFHNDEANLEAFTKDGWYRTGDVGSFTENGLKLISRKDRIFKLSNGEKVIPTDLEKAIELKCHYVQYAVVVGSGEEYPVALIFPNKKFLNNPDYQLSPEEGCFCPRSLNELGRCLTGCLSMANDSIGQKFAKIKSAAIILDELSVDNNTLTPSLKMAPKNVVEKYKLHLQNLFGNNVPVEEEVYIIELGQKSASWKNIS